MKTFWTLSLEHCWLCFEFQSIKVENFVSVCLSLKHLRGEDRKVERKIKGHKNPLLPLRKTFSFIFSWLTRALDERYGRKVGGVLNDWVSRQSKAFSWVNPDEREIEREASFTLLCLLVKIVFIVLLYSDYTSKTYQKCDKMRAFKRWRWEKHVKNSNKKSMK